MQVTGTLVCFIAGCSCHLAHLAAQKGGSAYLTSIWKSTKWISTIILRAVQNVKPCLWNVWSLSTKNRRIFPVTLPQDGYPKKKYYDKEMKKIAALNSMFANRIEKSSNS